jgi:hypothetical protein
MKIEFRVVGSLFFAALMVVSSAYSQDAARPSTKRSTAQKKAAQPSMQGQIQALQKALEAQSLKIDQQTQLINGQSMEINGLKTDLQQAKQQAADAQSAAEKASAMAASEQQAVSNNAAAVATLQSTVSNVRASAASLSRGLVNETEQLKKERANPTTLYYKGVSLTPGGFIAADTIYRTKGIGSDIPTSFNNLPYEGDNRYKLSEFYGSARPTRISLLFESKPKWGTLRGYYEADFQGVGTNSNNNQTNSYVMRQRVLYGEAETNSGWKLAFGQMWSLATEGDKGIPSNPSNIKTPLTIDTNYMPGFIWARQYGVRLVKSVHHGMFTFGVSAENPQLMYTASLAGNTPYAVLGSAGSSSGYNAAISSSTTTTYIQSYSSIIADYPSYGYTPEYKTITANTNIANYSFNAAPDMLVKAVADPGWGHYEIFGLIGIAHETIYPNVTTDRVKYGGVCDYNITYYGTSCEVLAAVVDPSVAVANRILLGGVGASFRIPVIKDKLSFGAKALYGPGVGRYGDSTLADVTSRGDGSLAPIHNLSGLLTLEYTPTQRLTLWANYGGDYAARADYSTVKTSGMGTPSPCVHFDSGNGCLTTDAFDEADLSSLLGNWGTTWFPGDFTIGSKTVNSTSFPQQAVGYGSRQAVNYTAASSSSPATGCNVTAAPGYSGSSTGYYASTPASCIGHTRNVQEITGGYYYDFYNGQYGRLRQGVQYGYAAREGWSGAAYNSVRMGAKGIDNMFWTSLRYYLP